MIADKRLFNLLHRSCGSRLERQYVCAKEGVVVEGDEIVKGYEFAKDQYIAFSVDELRGRSPADVLQLVEAKLNEQFEREQWESEQPIARVLPFVPRPRSLQAKVRK